MKNCLVILLVVFLSFRLNAQQWTAEELSSAYTVTESTGMSREECELVRYINLARMYPKRFAEIELVDFFANEERLANSMLSDNRLTLIVELMEMEPCGPLSFSKQKRQEAICLAKEQSVSGEVGHTRHKCSSSEGGENCGYGVSSGHRMALQLLLDEGVPEYGHRENCLNPAFASVGAAFDSHPVYKYCAVVDFGWGDYTKNRTLAYTSPKKLSADKARYYFQLMTKGVDARLVNSPAAHHGVLRTTTSMTEETHNGVTKRVDIVTRFLDNNKKYEVKTTTVTTNGVEKKSVDYIFN